MKDIKLQLINGDCVTLSVNIEQRVFISKLEKGKQIKRKEYDFKIKSKKVIKVKNVGTSSARLVGELLALRRQITRLCKHRQIWQCSEEIQNKVANVEKRIFEIEQQLEINKKMSRSASRHQRRNLGHESPFNAPFSGSVEHHIDPNTVINVPNKLHKSVSHSLTDSESMKKINQIILKWFYTKDQRVRSNIPCRTL